MWGHANTPNILNRNAASNTTAIRIRNPFIAERKARPSIKRIRTRGNIPGKPKWLNGKSK
jgi:hypothetical protein